MLDLGGSNPGDLPDGIFDHIKIVVGYGMTSTDPNEYGSCINGVLVVPTNAPTSVNAVLINQNCIDRKHVAWNYGVDSNAGKIFIHLIE